MISLKVPAPKSIATTATALLLAVLATHSVAAPRADADREQQLLEQVQVMLSRDGPYSAGVLSPLTGLSLLYQESGDHGLALVTIERALQVIRINRGLYTLEQVPWLLQKIHSEEALGNDAAVWAAEQELLTLARRHPDDVRAAAGFRAIADRQMEALRQYLRGEHPPDVILGCFYREYANSDADNCTAGSRKTVVQGMLAEAQRNYSAAVAVLLRRELYASEELRALERELLLGVDLMRTLGPYNSPRPVPMLPMAAGADRLEPWRTRLAPVIAVAAWNLPYLNDGRDENAQRRLARTHAFLKDPYQRGRQILRRLHAYAVASASPPLSQTAAIAQIADWDLLHAHYGLAISGYEVARASLQDAGVSAASIEQVFAPLMPVVLPAFRPNPLAQDETRPTTGHIDVAFTLTQYGRAKDVEVRGALNATDDAQEDLVRLIMRSRFRPRLSGGEFAAATPVAIRYHVYD